MMITQQKSLRALNTFGVDVQARYFVRVQHTDDLTAALRFARENALELLILGGGSNILLLNDFNGLVIKLEIMGITVIAETSENITLKIGAGENWHQFVTYCVEHGYSGIENLALIPGTVGAAPLQNIGAYGVELGSVFDSLEATRRNDGTGQIFTEAQCAFGYRDSCFKQEVINQFVITSVTLTLSKKPKLNLDYAPLNTLSSKDATLKSVYNAVIQARREKLPDPKVLPNAGSFFKNPIVDRETIDKLKEQFPKLPTYELTIADTLHYKLPAAWLIEYCGFKGKCFGQASVHQNQALVIVNSGNATGEDILALSKRIQKKVFATFGIQLNPEVNIV